VVSSIDADRFGALWPTGNRGLHRVRLEDLEAVRTGESSRLYPLSFGVDDGLENPGCSTLAPSRPRRCACRPARPTAWSPTRWRCCCARRSPARPARWRSAQLAERDTIGGAERKTVSVPRGGAAWRGISLRARYGFLQSVSTGNRGALVARGPPPSCATSVWSLIELDDNAARRVRGPTRNRPR
jgi:hypothetical protein